MISSLILVCLFKGQTQPYIDTRITAEASLKQQAVYSSLSTTKQPEYLADLCSKLNQGKHADVVYTVGGGK